MRFPGVAVILVIVGVLLISSDVAPVGLTIGPSPAADAKPVARSRPEVQRSVLDEDRDRDAALGVLLLLGVFEGRHGR